MKAKQANEHGGKRKKGRNRKAKLNRGKEYLYMLKNNYKRKRIKSLTMNIKIIILF